jgi:hypothetical protein
MELMCGARLVVTEGEGVVAGLRKLEEETAFGKYANVAQVGMGRWAGWAERPGGPAGRWADWAECEGKILF